MNWYVMMDNGSVVGPLTPSMIRRMELPADTLVSHNRSKWVALGKANLEQGATNSASQATEELDAIRPDRVIASPTTIAAWLAGLFLLIGFGSGSVVVILVGLWALAAWAGGFLARACGMQRNKGAVLGFLLGPLGLLIIVVAWAVRSDGTKTPDRV